MATSDRPRGGSRATTPENSATMGVILVMVALVVGLFLLVKGGGDAKDETTKEPGSGQTDGGGTAKTTSTVPPSTIPPAQLEVIAANGSGVSGRAKRTAELLKGVGYANVKYVDGTATATSMVFYVPDAQADAAGVAASLGLPSDRVQPMPQAIPLKDSQLGTAKVLVLVGPDFDPANPPPVTPSTTAAG